MEFWWRSFDLNIMVLSQATYLISIDNYVNSHTSPVLLQTILCALLLMTLKAKLPLEIEPVACDDNMIYTLKPDDQTFVAPLLIIVVLV